MCCSFICAKEDLGGALSTVSCSMQSYNFLILNIDAICGVPFTLRIQYEYTQTQWDEGARDGIDIWHMGIKDLPKWVYLVPDILFYPIS